MSHRFFFFQLLAILCVVILGSGLDIMEVDAAQYAGMSRDMVVSGEWLQLKYRGADYLDKPPLLFWASACSFQVFGVHDWSYRLPSILFAFLGLFATYRFALLYHARDVALSALLVYGCSVAFFLMCNDVRCDTMLTGAVITAIWLGCAWLEQGRWWQSVGMGLALAAGMLAKGPIGLVVPAMAIGAQLAFTRKWYRLQDPRWAIALAVVVLAMVPMCIGLYKQHGWHGIRFYFWEQSFGRITGENRWKDDSTVLYFTHELLWQLLPWTFFVLRGVWNAMKAVIRRTPLPEYASLGGALLAFVSLSLSQFKLPHYLYVTLPLFAVLAARELQVVPRWIQTAQNVLLAVLAGVLSFFVWSVFPDHRWPYAAVVAGFLLTALIGFFRGPAHLHLRTTSFWIMIAIGLVLNGQFYPQLLTYQANAKAGQWAAANQKSSTEFYGLQLSGGALDFYAGYPVSWLSNAAEVEQVLAEGVCIYTDAEHRNLLLEAGLNPVREVRLWNHPAQRLSLPFLRPERRAQLLEPRYILLY